MSSLRFNTDKAAVRFLNLETHLKDRVELRCDSSLLGGEVDLASWRAQDWVHVSASGVAE